MSSLTFLFHKRKKLIDLFKKVRFLLGFFKQKMQGSRLPHRKRDQQLMPTRIDTICKFLIEIFLHLSIKKRSKPYQHRSGKDCRQNSAFMFCCSKEKPIRKRLFTGLEKGIHRGVCHPLKILNK